MLTLHTKLTTPGPGPLYGELLLPYDQREKCRLRARLSSGEEVALFMVRGTVLRGGDYLTGADKGVVLVRAAPEATYAVHCGGPAQLARCAFHLGNRHTQVQIGETMLRIRADPVLKDMLEGLGARIDSELAPFEPEAGAYGPGHSHDSIDGTPNTHLLAPVPLRQKIHRPGDPA